MNSLQLCCALTGAAEYPWLAVALRGIEILGSLLVVLIVASYRPSDPVREHRRCAGVVAALLCGAFAVNALCLILLPVVTVTVHEVITAACTILVARMAFVHRGNVCRMLWRKK